MEPISRHRYWTYDYRPTVFSDRPRLEPGVNVFSVVPIDNGLAQRLADDAGGAAYLDGHYSVIRSNETGGAYLTEAAQWFGQSAVQLAGVDHLAKTWAWLNQAIAHYWKDPRVYLLATPSTAGRDLWLRTIPPGGEGWLTLPAALQETIRADAHQGRVQTMPAATETITGLVEYDIRLAYVAVSRGLPAGKPQWRNRPPATVLDAGVPSRHWVRFAVPDTWRHVGLLPVKTMGGAWSYPTEGEHETVIDGAELALALRNGWRVEITKSLVWPTTGDPFRTFFDRLLRILVDARRHSELTQHLVRSAVRAMALHTIGAMHGAPHKVTRTGAPSQVPDDADNIRLLDGGGVQWVELAAAAWPETCHPEWSAHIWARNRRRLLDHPTIGGVLSVPVENVVGVRTDAVYLTSETGWENADTGKPGAWVRKRTIDGPLPWPASNSELLKMRGN